MLAVRDDELDVGDDEDALSDVAEGGKRGRDRGSHADGPGNDFR